MREIRDSARRMGKPVPIEMAYKVGQKDFRLEVERVKNAKPDAVVHWGDAVEGAMVLNTMREMGMTQPFFGCDRTVSDEFVKIAGRNAEGVMAAFPWDPTRTSARLERFRKAYRERFGVEAETYAAHAYDGMNLLLWAIQVAGLNRAKIRDVIAHLPHPWPGVTGRHRLLRRPRRRRRHDARPLRGRPLALPHERGAPGAAGPHPAPRPAEPRLGRERAAKRRQARRKDRRRSRDRHAEARAGRRATARPVSPRRGRRGLAKLRPGAEPQTRRPQAGPPLDFRGPGREEPEPDVAEVVLGWFGPGDPATPSSATSGAGALLALEQENAAGGYRGKPFRLVPAWSESPWKAGIADLDAPRLRAAARGRSSAASTGRRRTSPSRSPSSPTSSCSAPGART